MTSTTQLTGRVIFQGDPGYNVARKNWDPRTDRFPKVFVFAQRTKDVVNAIKWARENHVPIRPRGGRHSLEGNFSQVNGGIVIDVSDINHIRLDKVNGTATIGTGNRVGRIAHTLARQGFIMPFGDSPSVGLGILPGGGIGPYQRTTGLISDNLLELEMVDANGKVIRANKSRNADLFWATQGGGGGNFGVYTQYKLKVPPAPANATVFSITWPWDQFEEVFKTWQVWAPAVNDKLGSELSIGPKKGGNVSMLGLFLGPKAEAVRLLTPITSVGTPTKFIQLLPYTQVVRFLLQPDPVLTHPFRSQFSSGFARRPFPEPAIKVMRQFLENIEGKEAGFFFLNWGGAVSRVAPRATAFFWRDPQFYVEWNTSWLKPSESAKNIAIVRNTRQKLQPYIVGSYVNVPDLGIKNPGLAYYGANFFRLRRVKTKYDPDNVFRNPQSIPPLRRP
ncbi:FAD-binding oxidoreductase [Marininema halotolerans]|uniref:FAD/FMN-containing dehydrogenase n=1 Tax=Marininema halotolerans TaxID=1155944 RepID=A0A1I6RQX0_9BACL|nr:FAD-binding oxidoreductase [Marininema halotolerans]SFS67084.1 FAD/FMN-containing dehydrogenase [Marininema halotolerans]